MTELFHLHRTLEQELLALARGVSLECLLCGEFVMRRGDALWCPECGSVLCAEDDLARVQVELASQAG